MDVINRGVMICVLCHYHYRYHYPLLFICVCQSSQVAGFISREGPIAEELSQMLSTGRTQVRSIAAAAVADLAHISPDAKAAFLEVRTLRSSLHCSPDP